MSAAARRARAQLLATRNVEGFNKLAPFPAVAERDARAGRSYDTLWAAWRERPRTALAITARVSGPVIPDSGGAIHIDGLLSAALLNSRLVGASMSRHDRFIVPLPLELLWVSPEGWPLWAATELRPVGVAPQAPVYIHKRHPTDRAPLARQTTVNTSAGRYKDVRMPLSTTVAPIWRGFAIGIAEIIHSLLADVDHIGRKGAIGQGRVLGWTVEPAPGIEMAHVMDGRPVPVACLAEWGESVEAARISPLGSWTPPYWDAGRHAAVRRSSWMS